MGLLKVPSHGGLSVRSIIGFALSVIITAFLWAIITSPPSHAQVSTAAWNSATGTILYDNHGYNVDTEVRIPGGAIPEGSAIYTAPVQGTAQGQKLLVLYFAPGVDPPTATTAKYVEFTFNNGSLSNPQGQRDITLTPQGEETANESSCSVSGIGWVICPVSIFLADSMDWLFEVLADNFIQVQPAVLGDENNSMYVAWNVMRSIANIAFAIVFIIIIYSQLTSLGVSNYGIKKLTPRLIVAAVLVNISFYIAALAIDLSNVAGYSVQQIFNGIREGLFNVTNDELSGVNTSLGWGAVAAVILAGGGTIGGVYFVASGGVYLLVPLLVGLGLTVLFVVLVFAARQAIIVILVIISPLAFVANLLPNTEKWFEKWKDLFMTMLVFFPAFALVFGGSQLAGQIIIQNAGDNIISLLFGMAVQIAPLVITPLILKLSGSLLGRIAQLANNPRKGALDRSRHWAERRAEHAKQQNMAQGPRWRNLGGGGMVRAMDFRKRRLNDSTEAWKQEATNEYEKSAKYGDIHERQNAANLKKDTIHSQHAAHIERLKTGSAPDRHNIRGLALDAQTAKERSETAQNDTTVYYNDIRTRGSHALRASSYNLETSKLRAEGSDSLRNAYYSNQKATAGTAIQNAAIHAESAKETQEAAQHKVSAVMDQQRRTASSPLNMSTINLETNKLSADTSKTLTSAYLSAEKLAVGSDLHREVIRGEQAKLSGQIGETRVSKMVEEYKSGKIVRTGELNTLMTTMVTDVEHLQAESQGVQAAKNVQTKNIAEAFTTGSPRAAELLNAARSVDPYGNVRAEANALATLDDIVNKARTANESLLEERALAEGAFPKDYAVRLLENRINGDTSQSEDIIRAAMEIAGKEAQIPVIRKMRKSVNINQDHLSAMLLRNSGTMKAKGGFDLQADPNLMLASDEVMNASVAGTLGSVAASQFKDLKNGAIKEYSANMDTIIADTFDMSKSTAADTETRNKERGYGARGIEGVQKTYFNLSIALRDPQMVRELGDNLIPAIKMHRKIHNDPRFHNDDMAVDYAAIDPQNLSL